MLNAVILNILILIKLLNLVSPNALLPSTNMPTCLLVKPLMENVLNFVQLLAEFISTPC